MHDYKEIQPFLTWLSHHTAWAGVVVFTISLCESLAGIGVIIPGLALMGGVGWLIGIGTLPLISTLAWATFGAVIGDNISYWIGAHYKDKLRRLWPFSQYPHWLSNGEKFFLRHGGKSIILGRFIGPIRPMIPVIAGMMDMPSRRFFAANVISALAWAPLYTLPGILVGSSFDHLGKYQLKHLTIGVLTSLVVIWLLYTLLSILYRNLSKSLQNYCHFARKNSATYITGLLFIIPLAAWIIYDANVGGVITAYNQFIFAYLQKLRAAHLDAWMQGVSLVANHKVITFAFAAILVSLFAIRQHWAALHGAALYFYAEFMTLIVKYTTKINRPIEESGHGFSFPSGHTFRIAVVLGFIAYLLGQHQSKETKHSLAGVVISLIVIEAFSRLYLGAHWFSDIIGAMLLAGIGMTLTALSYERRTVAPIRPAPLICFSLVSFAVSMAFFTGLHHARHL